MKGKFSFLSINYIYTLRRADLSTGSAAHTLLLVIFRLTPELFCRNVRFIRKFGGIRTGK
jgi:hypothetical protein